MNLSDENIELILFRYKEGLLDKAESAEVERALQERPDWQEMADLYDPGLTLPAGATIPYADFETLRDGGPKAATREHKPISLRDSDTPRRRLMPLWTAVAAAACLLLFVTTIVKFVNGGGNANGPLVAELDTNSIAVPTETSIIPDNEAVAPSVTNTVHRAIRSDAPTLLAETTTIETMTNEESRAATEPQSPALATPKDTSVYDLDEPTLREVNDPMDQEVLYANIIDWQTSSPESTGNTTRRQQLRNIARKATSIIATATSNYEEHRDDIEDAIEERMQSNQFVNNLIAAIE